ncbi:MAG: hypothetical protein KF802_16395 [Bdellovibrionaceae bacterium]|nr:hypothetical protein [Pseudobdellovibrionaceae bacterium]
MSWEAWGDDDDQNYDHLIEAGWWWSEKVDDVRSLVTLLMNEPIYEGGKKENGVSTRFLAHLTLLKHEFDLPVDEALVKEADAMLAARSGDK